MLHNMELIQFMTGASQVAPVVKRPPANAGDISDCRFDPWVGKIPWRRARQPTPVFFPGESHGQRRLAGYSPWSCKERARTEQLTHTQSIGSQSQTPLKLFVIYLYRRVKRGSEAKVAQLCPTPCDPMDSTARGILQARILEWVAFPFSRRSSQPRSPTLLADSLPAEPQGKR